MNVESSCQLNGEVSLEDMVYQYDSETATLYLNRGYIYDLTTITGDNVLYTTLDLRDDE